MDPLPISSKHFELLAFCLAKTRTTPSGIRHAAGLPRVRTSSICDSRCLQSTKQHLANQYISITTSSLELFAFDTALARIERRKTPTIFVDNVRLNVAQIAIYMWRRSLNGLPTLVCQKKIPQERSRRHRSDRNVEDVRYALPHLYAGERLLVRLRTQAGTSQTLARLSYSMGLATKQQATLPVITTRKSGQDLVCVLFVPSERDEFSRNLNSVMSAHDRSIVPSAEVPLRIRRYLGRRGRLVFFRPIHACLKYWNARAR